MLLCITGTASVYFGQCTYSIHDYSIVHLFMFFSFLLTSIVAVETCLNYLEPVVKVKEVCFVSGVAYCQQFAMAYFGVFCRYAV